jgi:hypothetical protein
LIDEDMPVLFGASKLFPKYLL